MEPVGYFCSYVPEELIEACGFQALLFEPGFSPSWETPFPVPFCALCKAFTDWTREQNPLLHVIPLSCDASRRTFELLSFLGKPVLPLDVPATTSERAVQRFAENLKELTRRLSALREESFSLCEERLKAMLPANIEKRKEYLEKLKERAQEKDRIPVLLVGSHFAPLLVPLLEEKGFVVFADIPKNRPLWVEDFPLSPSPFEDLARLYLSFRLSCPKLSGKKRRTTLKRVCQDLNLQGVIVFFSKFCDFTLYEIGLLRQEISLPVLLLEHDNTPSFSQWETRIEAFREMLERG